MKPTKQVLFIFVNCKEGLFNRKFERLSKGRSFIMSYRLGVGGGSIPGNSAKCFCENAVS